MDDEDQLPPNIMLRKLEGPEITDNILKDAAELFSTHYGVWGPLAAETLGTFAQAGKRVKMSAARLRQQVLPEGAMNTMVSMLLNGQLVGHVFATLWTFKGEKMCWITQLVVHEDFRNKGIATELVEELVKGQDEQVVFGILSSHPYAIKTLLRAVGHGHIDIFERVEMVRAWARAMVDSCPVTYVKEAKLRGSLFEVVTDGTVSCADTNFWVDHTESLEAVSNIKAECGIWSYGELLEGHEFLAVVEYEPLDL